MATQNDADQIYAKKQTHLVDFVFDDRVASVFPDMIRRSVPGYDTILTMTGVFAEQYLHDGGVCYDLGCSLGASSLAVASHTTADRFSIIAIDNAPAMVERCKGNLAAYGDNVDVRCADIEDVLIENASLVILNFTLQFISPTQREALLKVVYEGIRPGGALILSEKICFENSEEQTLQTELHHAFKRANGYSDLEISQKRTALENVLIPESIAAHHQRLKHVGFRSVSTWFQCFNFASILAVKS